MTTYPFAPRPNSNGSTEEETNEEFRERIVAILEHQDALSRRERAERLDWLGKNEARMPHAYLERTETCVAMQEARSSYVHGNFAATLALALSYVEHVINDALPPRQPNERFPTMTGAIEMARKAGLLPGDLLDAATVLSTFRNPFMHRRHPDDPDTLGQRIRNRKAHPKTILEHDARDALLLMFEFARLS